MAKKAKALKAKEKADKQERAALRLAKKRKLEDSLAEKMKALMGVKKVLVARPAVELTKAEMDAKKKATIEAFFLASRNKNASAPSDPISSDESGADGLRFLASGQSPQVITVSEDTLPPASGSAGSNAQCSSRGRLQLLIDLVSGGSKVNGSSNLVEDDLDLDLCDPQELSLSNEDEDDEEGPELAAKKQKTNYDSTRKFQLVWAVKLPWAEAILASDGVLQMVKCTICSEFDKKPCILGSKWDTLTKHEGRRKAKTDMPKFGVKKGQYYIAKDCRHRKNMRFHLAKNPTSILQQVVTSSNRNEFEKKKV